MKASELLRKVAETLWDGCGTCHEYKGDPSRFLCNQTEIVAHLDRTRYGARQAANQVKDRITRYLNGFRTVDHWLYEQGAVAGSTEEVQAYRKAWALHLADEFEAEGD